MESLNLILTIVSALVGFPAFLAAGINVAKYFGLPDGLAGPVNFWSHLLVYVGVGIAVYNGKVDIVNQIDAQLGAISQLLIAILSFLSSMSVARLAHRTMRGLPFVGYSHSAS